MADKPTAPSESDWYRHDDVDEIVFAVDDGHILTVREYPSFERFRDEVRQATYVGTHADVDNIPDVDEFKSDSGSQSEH
jgi:hypothetical protein